MATKMTRKQLVRMQNDRAIAYRMAAIDAATYETEVFGAYNTFEQKRYVIAQQEFAAVLHARIAEVM